MKLAYTLLVNIFINLEQNFNNLTLYLRKLSFTNFFQIMWYHIIMLFPAYFEPVWFDTLVIYWALPKHIILSGNTTIYRVFMDTTLKLLLK